MNTKYIGTKNLLLSIINKGEVETVDFTIALYLLKHYRNLQDINIYDMAENCYVNRSTIRRFFVKYGYHNFLDFKNHYTNQLEEDNFNPALFHNYASYLNDLNGKIMNMMSQFTLKRDKTTEIDYFNMHLYNSEKIVFLGDESFYGQLYNAQQEMIGLGKIVYFITNNIQDHQILKSLTEHDCLVVFSLKGNYAKEVLPEFKNLSAYKILLTLHKNEQLSTHFDYTCQLTRNPEEADEAVYRKYGVTYFIDTMISTYKIKYINNR